MLRKAGIYIKIGALTSMSEVVYIWSQNSGT